MLDHLIHSKPKKAPSKSHAFCIAKAINPWHPLDTKLRRSILSTTAFHNSVQEFQIVSTENRTLLYGKDTIFELSLSRTFYKFFTILQLRQPCWLARDGACRKPDPEEGRRKCSMGSHANSNYNQYCFHIYFPDYKESLFFLKGQQGFRGHGGSLKYEGLLLGGCRAEDGLGVFLTRL